MVPAAVKRHRRSSPEGTEDLDLFLHASTARVKVRPESLVLDIVPSHANAEPQAASTQHIDLRRLLGHEGGLALREDQDSRHQFNPASARGEMAEQHERL